MTDDLTNDPLRGTSHSMDRALEQQSLRLEQLIVRTEAKIALMGLVLGTFIAFRISRSLGTALMCFAGGLAVYWHLCSKALERGIGLKVLPRINPLLEGSIGTSIVLIDFYTNGALFAASAPGILIYCLLASLAVLRLQPILPVIVGVLGAAEYGVVYALLIHPALAGQTLPGSIGPDMAVVRMGLIALSGLGGTAVAFALRNAVIQATREVRANDLFGKYRTGTLIAAGGMGSVYRAVYCPEGGFKRPVALKKIHPHLAAQEELVQAFRTEAELCARLLHPNIVQVLDFGRIGDTFFFAMEFIDGGTLSNILKRAEKAKVQIPARLCAFIAREICRGLNFAHRIATDDEGHVLRIVHRDLNPPNVLVSRAGQVKILDFGIAKALRDAEQSATKTTAGKVGYLSPEQAQGKPIDERCDLFALGIIVWEMLCLQPLYKRDNEFATLHALLMEDVPSPRVLRPELNAAWDAFFTKALARNIEQRFSTALEMAEALDTLIAREGAPHPGELPAFLRSLPELGGKVQEDQTIVDDEPTPSMAQDSV